MDAVSRSPRHDLRGRLLCDHRTLPRRVRGIWGFDHACDNPAKFRVRGAPDRHGREKVSLAGDTPCGLHARPYLMDNGDSVWKPWIVEPLEAAA